MDRLISLKGVPLDFYTPEEYKEKYRQLPLEIPGCDMYACYYGITIGKGGYWTKVKLSDGLSYTGTIDFLLSKAKRDFIENVYLPYRESILDEELLSTNLSILNVKIGDKVKTISGSSRVKYKTGGIVVEINEYAVSVKVRWPDTIVLEDYIVGENYSQLEFE